MGTEQVRIRTRQDEVRQGYTWHNTTQHNTKPQPNPEPASTERVPASKQAKQGTRSRAVKRQDRMGPLEIGGLDHGGRAPCMCAARACVAASTCIALHCAVPLCHPCIYYVQCAAYPCAGCG